MDIITNKTSASYEFIFSRDDESESRVLSFELNDKSEATVQRAKNFRDIFTGGVSSPFAAINPREFIQPTGWRDNDPDEDPWTTTNVRLSITEGYTTYYDWDSGGDSKDVQTVTFSPSTLSAASIGTSDVESVTVTAETGTAFVPSISVSNARLAANVEVYQGQLLLYLKRWDSQQAVQSNTTVTLHFPETPDYAETSAVFTLN